MKTSLFLSAFVATLLLSSFKGPKHPAKITTAAGVYGVCSGDALPFKFELSLNPDHTFHYVNTSVPGKAIDTNGTWEQNGNVVTLSNYTSQFPINKKWKIDKDNQKCLKSRKGMLFTRLCHLEPCL